MATAGIEAELEASGRLIESIKAFIQAQILGSWPDRIPGVDAIVRNLEHMIEAMETVMFNAYTAIKTQIDPLLKNAIPSAFDFLASVTSSLDSHLTQLLGNIATTEDVLGAAVNELRKYSPALAGWVMDHVAGSFGAVALGVLKQIETEAPEAIDPILDELLRLPNLPPWLAAPIHSARKRNAPFFAFLLPAIILASLLPVLGALGDPIVTAARQMSFDLERTKVAPPNVLVQAQLRDLIVPKRFYDEMGQSGFAGDVADLHLNTARELLAPEVLTKAYIRGNITEAVWAEGLKQRGITADRARIYWDQSRSLPSENDAREAFLRGIITADQHDAMLSQLGFKDTVWALRRQLYFYIPPAQDLIHMAIRNVFNDEIVTRFQLFGDFPPPFERAAAQQGISREWALRYWGAHWIVPGNEEAFAMFQRTTDTPLDDNADPITLSDGTIVHNIIGGSTLKLLLREKDIAPFYRDKLTQLAYHPLTRIDVRRLAAIGLLSHAEVERAYLDLGYSQKNAKRLADFVDALNKRTRKDEAAHLVDNLRKETLRLYVQGKLSEAEADQTLTDLNFTPAEVAVYKAEALLVARAERLTRIETRIGRLYVAGVIDAAEAEKRLVDHDVPVAARTQLFGEWNLDIEYRGGTEHIHKHRELTKAEIVQALIDGIVDEPTAIQLITDSGYDDLGARAEVSLALFKRDTATRKAQLEAIKGSFVNGVIDLLDASNRLDRLRIPGEQRDALLFDWTLQRETRTERIPIATLRDMVKGEYLTESDAFAHLKRHRFTDEDANLLLKFWANQPPPKRLQHA